MYIYIYKYMKTLTDIEDTLRYYILRYYIERISLFTIDYITSYRGLHGISRIFPDPKKHRADR